MVTGGQDTIGLRCPNNPLTLELLRQFGGGLAAPSANRFGHISPTTAQHVRDEFGAQTPMILDAGACDIGIESTIVDLTQTPARILRPGQISFEQLQVYIPDLQQGAQVNSPRVSGDLLAHYAPRTAMKMLNRNEIPASATHQKIVALCFESLPEGIAGITIAKHAETYAQQLYANLRALDNLQADLIIIEQIPQTEQWLAIADRLKRALVGSGNL
jgi:L-threonylcarbamoyladenylate synthase